MGNSFEKLTTVSGITGVVGVPFLDAAIAQRNVWQLSDKLTDLDISTPRVLVIINGSNADVTLKLKVTASAAVQVDLYQQPTYEVVGTALTLRNSDLKVADTADVAVYHTPTASVDGTLIWAEMTSAQAAGAGDVGGTFVLKASVPYLLRLTAVADNTLANTLINVIDDASGTAAVTSTTTTSTTTTTTT